MSVTDAPQVLSVMIGTAGHVDHGKTSLVKSLTGFETDTMKEEKERGMSIDLGVAPCLLPGNRLVGLIDVPGHEDFIKNMVAGASSIDVLLLVVAADDAVMPQTVEHMRIVKLLGMSEVMVAVTKVDLVEPDVLELVRQDVADFMQCSGFPEAAIIPVSNITGEGVAIVKQTLSELVERIQRRPDNRAFRMYIRHVFSKKGYGTVVTGVPVSGTVHSGEAVVVEPGGKTSGVRAVQTYRREADAAQAHVSSAINLRDLEPSELRRGLCLVHPAAYAPVRKAVAVIQSVHAEVLLERRGELRLLSGTDAVHARYRLLDKAELIDGESALAELSWRKPMVLAAGDRFILRTLSPGATIGGGIVLSVRPGSRLKVSQSLLERLAAARMAAEDGRYAEAELLAGANPLVSKALLAGVFQQQESDAAAGAARLAEARLLRSLPSEYWLVTSRISELTRSLQKALERYHREHKNTWGMKPGYAAELFGLPPQTMDKLVPLMLEHEPKLALKHGYLALSSFSPQIGAREMKLRDQLFELVQAAGPSSEAMGNAKEKLGMTQNELKLVLKLLVDEGLIVVIANNLLLKTIYDEWRRALYQLFERQPVVDLKAFRDATGASRNVAVSVLELFDSEGTTRRQGEGRVLKTKLQPK